MRKKILIGLSALVVLGLAAAAAGYWVAMGPNTRSYDDARSVLIPRGAGLSAVVDSLDARGILASRTTFGWVARATGWGGQVKAGHYRIPAGASNYDILQKLRRGLQDPVRLTIPPGTRPEVVAAVAGRDMAFEPDDFLAALRDPALADSLGTDTTHLFGFMLPETYHFYWLTSAADVVARVKQEFDRYYERELAAGADTLNLTPEDVTALAGIIEWETGLDEERARVAGVYVNRLRRGMKLDADPTVQYIVQVQEGRKRRLLYADLRIPHPYNTYLQPGLPPGPITNPSKSSLKAAVNPESHDYLYFVASAEGDGSHVFSRSYDEHLRAVARYRARMNEIRARQQAEEAR